MDHNVRLAPYPGAAVAAAGFVQAGAKRNLSPSLRRTERNHRVDAPVSAVTSAAVTTVESIRNRAVGSVTISTARLAASSRKIPAHSQVAPWKKRSRPGGMGGRLPQRDHFSRQFGDERVRAARCPGEQDAHAQVRERELQQEEPEFAGGEHHSALRREHHRRNR